MFWHTSYPLEFQEDGAVGKTGPIPRFEIIGRFNLTNVPHAISRWTTYVTMAKCTMAISISTEVPVRVYQACYENPLIQIYRKFHLLKLKMFYISAQNIDCQYSLDPPHRGESNEYLQSMFLSRK